LTLASKPKWQAGRAGDIRAITFARCGEQLRFADCDWPVQGTDGKEFGLDKSSGYGKVRNAHLVKQGDAWVVTKVSTVDMGEP
jgi:hypothetical protein